MPLLGTLQVVVNTRQRSYDSPGVLVVTIMIQQCQWVPMRSLRYRAGWGHGAITAMDAAVTLAVACCQCAAAPGIPHVLRGPSESLEPHTAGDINLSIMPGPVHVGNVTAVRGCHIHVH